MQTQFKWRDVISTSVGDEVNDKVWCICGAMNWSIYVPTTGGGVSSFSSWLLLLAQSLFDAQSSEQSEPCFFTFFKACLCTSNVAVIEVSTNDVVSRLKLLVSWPQHGLLQWIHQHPQDNELKIGLRKEHFDFSWWPQCGYSCCLIHCLMLPLASLGRTRVKTDQLQRTPRFVPLCVAESHHISARNFERVRTFMVWTPRLT